MARDRVADGPWLAAGFLQRPRTVANRRGIQVTTQDLMRVSAGSTARHKPAVRPRPIGPIGPWPQPGDCHRVWALPEGIMTAGFSTSTGAGLLVVTILPFFTGQIVTTNYHGIEGYNSTAVNRSFRPYILPAIMRTVEDHLRNSVPVIGPGDRSR